MRILKLIFTLILKLTIAIITVTQNTDINANNNINTNHNWLNIAYFAINNKNECGGNNPTRGVSLILDRCVPLDLSSGGGLQHAIYSVSAKSGTITQSVFASSNCDPLSKQEQVRKQEQIQEQELFLPVTVGTCTPVTLNGKVTEYAIAFVGLTVSFPVNAAVYYYYDNIADCLGNAVINGRICGALFTPFQSGSTGMGGCVVSADGSPSSYYYQCSGNEITTTGYPTSSSCQGKVSTYNELVLASDISCSSAQTASVIHRNDSNILSYFSGFPFYSCYDAHNFVVNALPATASCFAGDSTVALSDGSMKYIRDVTLGDNLMVVSHSQKERYSVLFSPVIALPHTSSEANDFNSRASVVSLVELVSDSGAFIRMTMQHLVLVLESQQCGRSTETEGLSEVTQLVQAIDVKEGDCLILLSNNLKGEGNGSSKNKITVNKVIKKLIVDSSGYHYNCDNLRSVPNGNNNHSSHSDHTNSHSNNNGCSNVRSKSMDLYSVVTLEGDYIVVNGVIASPFAVNHSIAAAFYAVYRLLWRLTHYIEQSFYYTENNSNHTKIGISTPSAVRNIFYSIVCHIVQYFVS